MVAELIETIFILIVPGSQSFEMYVFCTAARLWRMLTTPRESHNTTAVNLSLFRWCVYLCKQNFMKSFCALLESCDRQDVNQTMFVHVVQVVWAF